MFVKRVLAQAARDIRITGLHVATIGFTLFLLSSTAAFAGSDDWPMFHHDPERTGVSSSSMPDPANMTLLWSYTIPVLFGDPPPIHTSPAVADDMVYFVGRNRRLYCLDANDGSLIWNRALGTSWEYGDVFGEDWLDSSPCVAEGKVFVGARDGGLYAFDASTGDSEWTGAGSSRQLESYTVSSPAYSSGALYIASFDGIVYKLDPDDGSDICTPVDLSDEGNIYNSPAVSGNLVIVGVGEDEDDGGTVESVSWGPHCDNSSVIPGYETSCWVRSTPVIVGSNIFQGDGSSSAPRGLDKLYGVSTLVWNYQQSGGLNPGEWTCATPAVDGDRIYMSRGKTDDYDFYCLVDGGSTVSLDWSTDVNAQTASGLGLQGSPAVADGLVFVGATVSNEATLYCLDAEDGSILESFALGGDGELFSSPAIVNGRVFIGAPDGTLYCFGEDTYQSRAGTLSPPQGGSTATEVREQATRILSRAQVREMRLDLYDLQGRRVQNPTDGIYYVKEGGAIIVKR